MQEEERNAEFERIKKKLQEEFENENPPQKIDKIIEKQSIIEEIFEQTESLTQKQFKNKKKNENEKIDLVGGGQINLTVLALEIQKHPSQFPQEYYDEIYRVYTISGNPSVYYKDKVCADITVEVVYCQFKKDVVPTIQQQNKYIGYCQREHKYYQFLNDKGIVMLKGFISNTINALKESSSEFEFRKLMFKRHGVPYQIDAFNQN